MQNKGIDKRNWWERTKSFIRSNIGLTVIIVALLLIELTTGVIYYSSQNIIQRTVVRLMERENNALYLCIRNKLADVEVTLDNIAWVATDDLVSPDSLVRVFRKVLNILKANDDSQGYLTLKDDEGEKWHVFYTPVGGKTNWILVNCLNDTDVLGKLRRVRRNLLFVVLAGFIPIGFIVYRTSRNLKRLRKVNAEKDRISSELHVASQIQQSMLPPGSLTLPEADIYGSLVPAREVGGDLYDYFVRDEKLFFCIGDVSGKGVPSAMVMAVNHALFLSASAHETNPARIMHSLNEIACQGNKSNMFVTLFIGVLDLPTGHLRYCNAGHDAPFVMHNEQGTMHNKQGDATLSKREWSMVDANPHLPIGLFEDVRYSMMETYLQPDSTIFLYTDGLTEARNSEHKLFGIKRVEDVLATCTDKHPKELLEAVSEAVHGFVGDAEQSDDLTMLAIRYTPQQYKSTLHETLTLKNDVREVTRLSSFQKSFYEKMNLGQSLARQLRLAVEEAVVNVIEYAYPAGVEGHVDITMMSDGHNLKVVIDDSGMAFDPTVEKKVDTTLSIEERGIGGLGIHLVRELMDSINYERINGHNILTLRKQINM